MTASGAGSLTVPRSAAWSVVAKAAFSGATAALVTSAAEAPWSSVEAVFVGALLLLPAGLFAGLASGVVVTALARGRGERERRRLALILVTAAACAFVLLLGTYLANVLLVAPLLGFATVVGYVITSVLAALVALFVRRRVLPSKVGMRLVALGPSGLLALLALAGTLVAVFLDVTCLPLHYWWAHVVLACVALIGAATFAQCALRYQPAILRSGSVVLAVIAFGFGLLARSDPTVALARHPTVHRRAWLTAGRVIASFGPRALAPPVGCAADTSAAPPGELTAPHRVVVLITIDAFRCGFGQGDRSELRDACPMLTKLTSEGVARLDAHASMPLTVGSTQAMQTIDGEVLGAKLRRAGYATNVISTHPNVLRSSEVRASFDEVDETLMPVASSGSAITSNAVRDRALGALRAMAADKKPHFLWAHFFDPHEPYTEREGATFRVSHLRAYETEVRRTDAAVADVVAAVRGFAEDEAIILVTADHGEEFGEHGATNHGASLYEEATRIPMLVWTSGMKRPHELPSGSVDVGRFLFAHAAGGSFAPSSDVVLRIAADYDDQWGLVRGGWKLVEHRALGYSELYDLRADPFEQRDLSRSHPAQLADLRCRLAR